MKNKSAENMDSPMEMRLAEKEDMAGLREIWKQSFGDEDSFLDLYFESRDWIGETAVMISGGKAVSMLTMIPVETEWRNGCRTKAAMLYAIATHPGFQKRGYADQLIEFSNRYQLSNGVFATVLVPAREELVPFYEKRGYVSKFYIREAVLTSDEIRKPAYPLLSVPEFADCSIGSADPRKYNETRKKLLKDRSFLDYRQAEIFFQKSLSRLFDTDLLLIEADKEVGCAYYERISAEEVLIKELLISDVHVAAVLKLIARRIPAKKYTVRTPAFAGENLGGIIRPFGMIRVNGDEGERIFPASCSKEKEFYLGIAYD